MKKILLITAIIALHSTTTLFAGQDIKEDETKDPARFTAASIPCAGYASLVPSPRAIISALILDPRPPLTESILKYCADYTKNMHDHLFRIPFHVRYPFCIRQHSIRSLRPLKAPPQAFKAPSALEAASLARETLAEDLGR